MYCRMAFYVFYYILVRSAIQGGEHPKKRRVDREDRKWEELSIEKWSGVERSGVERVRVGGHERIDEREVDRIGQERRGEERGGVE